MKENTALKFQNEESFKLVKDNLSVEFLNPMTLLGVAEKAVASIEYWEKRKLKGSPTTAQLEIYNNEIAKLEALIQRMTTLSLDVYSVNSEAYLDSRGEIKDTSVEDVLTEIAEKTEPKEDAKSISIFTNEDELVETPTIDDLKAAIKQVLKKGHFDSAQLLATKYLSVGKYVPKKPLPEGKEPEKWSENKIAGWIRDLNNTLMEEKQKSKTDKPAESVDLAVQNGATDNTDAASKGLTTAEVEDLRLLNTIVTDTLAGHSDYQSRREILKEWFHTGETLEKENEMLWAVGKRSVGLAGAKLPAKELADTYKDLDAFCKKFFAHRPYTEDSVKKWRAEIQKTIGVKNFEYLTTDKKVDPAKLAKANIDIAAIEKRVKEEFEAGKTVEDIVKTLEGGLLYKEIPSKEKGSEYKMYTKLHLLDLISRMYSVHSSQANNTTKTDPDLKKATLTSDKIDVAEVKNLITTMIENGAELVDIHTHPEVLGLINKEIYDGVQAPAMKFGNETTLFAWLDPIFTEIDAEYEPVEDDVVETAFADLDKMLILAEFAAKNDVSQEDFVKENKDMLLREDGSFKSMQSTNAQGGSKTIVVSNLKDFEVWVSGIYEAQKKVKTTAEEATSLKELTAKGWSKITAGTTYENFIEWLKKNLLNRQMKEQKPEKVFTTAEAIVDFAKNTFGKKLPKPAEVETAKVEDTTKKSVPTTEPSKDQSGVDNVTEPDASFETGLSAEQIQDLIKKESLLPDAVFAHLARRMRDLYIKNEVKVGEESMTAKMAIEMLEDVIKDINPEMYVARMQRKAEAEAADEKSKALLQGVLPFTKKDDETTKEESEVDEPLAGEVAETVDAEHTVFEKIDIAAVDPALWDMIKGFKTMDEVYNMAVEFNEAGKFNEALSMCLLVMPTQIEASKDWTADQVTAWFDANVLKKAVTPATEEPAKPAETKPETIKLGEEYKDLMESTNKKSTKQAIAAILKKKEDKEQTRKELLEAVKTGKGSHTRTVGKMPDK